MKRLHSQKGVTLLEMVLCIALLGIMGFVASPILGNSTSAVNLDAAAKQIEADMRFAQNMATTTSNDYKWQATSTTAYQVLDNLSAVTTSPYDHQPMNVNMALSYPNTSLNSGSYSTTFTGGTGSPATGSSLSIVLTNSVTGTSKTITLTASGNINLQ